MGGVTPTVLEVLGAGALSAVVAYFVGKSQNRDQTRRDQAAESLTEMRRMLLELRDAFSVATNPSEYRLPDDSSRLEQIREITRKLDEFNGY